MSIKWTTQKKIDKFLEMDNFPRLNRKEVENMNRLIIRIETESVILKLPTNKIEEQKSYDHLNRCRQNSTSIYDKNSQ